MDEGSGRIELDCGIACNRICAWLDDELALTRGSSAWVYVSDGGRCLVETHALEPRAFGRIALERTSLVISGDEQAIASFRKLLTLRFASAGG